MTRSGAGLDVRRLDGPHGARIREVDLSAPITDTVSQKIMTALAAHRVLVFPDQRLDKTQLAAATRRFGPAGAHILRRESGDAVPEVTVASNAGPDGEPNGEHTDRSTFRWHTDRSFMPRPAVATLFYGVEVPASGGDTSFADTIAAYRALPDAMKTKIDGLQAIHWIGYSDDERHGGLGGITQAELERAPPVRHPLARRHDVSGEKAIYCGCHAWKVEGMEAGEGRALLDALVVHATQARFVYRHRWRPHDLVMWDNRATLHRGSAFAGDREIRLMYRTIVEAEIPD